MDTDSQGRAVEQTYAAAGIASVRLDGFSDVPSTPSAIEDVIGVEDYVRFVNEFYATFPWFRSLDPGQVAANRGALTLGRFLEKYFQSTFGENFSKVAVAAYLAPSIEDLSIGAKARLFALLREIRRLV